MDKWKEYVAVRNLDGRLEAKVYPGRRLIEIRDKGCSTRIYVLGRCLLLVSNARDGGGQGATAFIPLDGHMRMDGEGADG